jgi:hypothetical protein
MRWIDKTMERYLVKAKTPSVDVNGVKQKPIELVGFPYQGAGFTMLVVRTEGGGVDEYVIDRDTMEPLAKKVDKQHLGWSFNEEVFCGSCPNCGHTVASARNYPYELRDNEYCGHCGQRLDWSE